MGKSLSYFDGTKSISIAVFHNHVELLTDILVSVYIACLLKCLVPAVLVFYLKNRSGRTYRIVRTYPKAYTEFC